MSSGGGVAATSFASMLEAMSREAGAQVTEGIRRLRRVLNGRVERPTQLPLYVYVAVRQLYRTYLTLTWEVSHLGSLDVTTTAALDRLSRNHLVQRIHRTGGDFALITRVCKALRPHVELDARIAEAEEVLLSWTDREAHLFCMLVPLANYTDEVRKEVGQLLNARARVPTGAADSRVKEAQRAMAPVLRHLGRTTQLLHEFGEELKPLTNETPGAPVASTLHKEDAVLNDLKKKALNRPREVTS